MSGRATIGTYTGDGVNGRAITGVGFAPEAVIVNHQGSSFGFFYFRNASMTGNGMSSKGTTTAFMIQSLDSDGFTVGATGTESANQNTFGFDWIAFADTSKTDFDYGTYTGNGASPRNIAVAFTPTVVLCGYKTSGLVHWNDQYTDTTKSMYWGSGNPPTWGNEITGNGVNLFTVGANQNVNGTEFFWIAFKRTAGSDFFDNGTYTGNATDDRNIQLTASNRFQPKLVHIFGQESLIGSDSAWHHDSFSTGDSTQELRSGAPTTAANMVQQKNSDGFQIGTHDNVNFNNEKYYYEAWGAGLQITLATLPEPSDFSFSMGLPFSPYQRYKSVRQASLLVNNLGLGT